MFFQLENWEQRQISVNVGLFVKSGVWKVHVDVLMKDKKLSLSHTAHLKC